MWWPNNGKAMQEKVSNCPICCQYCTKTEQLNPSKLLDWPWLKVAIDVCGCVCVCVCWCKIHWFVVRNRDLLLRSITVHVMFLFPVILQLELANSYFRSQDTPSHPHPPIHPSKPFIHPSKPSIHPSIRLQVIPTNNTVVTSMSPVVVSLPQAEYSTGLHLNDLANCFDCCLFVLNNTAYPYAWNKILRS